MNWGWPGDRNLSSLFHGFASSVVQEFRLFQKFSLFFGSYAKSVSMVKSTKFVSSGKLVGSSVTALGLTANWSLDGEKISINIYFAVLLNVSLQLPLLQAEQHQLSQPILAGEVFQPSDQCCDPPLDLLQQLHVLLVLRAPELDRILQVGSHQSRAEGQNHLPHPAGHASLDVAQDTVGLLGCKCTFVAHVQLFIHQQSQVLLSRAALNSLIPKPCIDTEGCPDPGEGPCTWPC